MTFLTALKLDSVQGNLLSSSAVHYSGHPTFLDFLENNLIDYIVHQKALPKATRIHHWYELVSMTKQIEFGWNKMSTRQCYFGLSLMHTHQWPCDMESGLPS